MAPDIIQREIRRRQDAKCTTDFISTIKTSFKYATYFAVPFGIYNAYFIQKIRAPISLITSAGFTALPIIVFGGGIGVLMGVFGCLMTFPDRIDVNNLKKNRYD